MIAFYNVFRNSSVYWKLCICIPCFFLNMVYTLVHWNRQEDMHSAETESAFRSTVENFRKIVFIPFPSIESIDKVPEPAVTFSRRKFMATTDLNLVLTYNVLLRCYQIRRKPYDDDLLLSWCNESLICLLTDRSICFEHTPRE